ncbi:dimethyladenosine transferase [Tolypothrix sp. PCC 7601]|nr:dimethyladenosine transferase [Tolypothrix sp. PCC 7601]
MLFLLISLIHLIPLISPASFITSYTLNVQYSINSELLHCRFKNVRSSNR